MSNVRAMDPTAILPWYPKCDVSLPIAERFTIMYSPMDMHQEAAISDDQLVSTQKGKESKSKYFMNKADVQRIELSIKDWKNLIYPDTHPDTGLRGKSCPYSKENIKCIPIEIRKEFVEDLTGRNKETDDEGNSLGEAKAA